MAGRKRAGGDGVYGNQFLYVVVVLEWVLAHFVKSGRPPKYLDVYRGDSTYVEESGAKSGGDVGHRVNTDETISVNDGKGTGLTVDDPLHALSGWVPEGRTLVEILLPHGNGFRTRGAEVGAATSDALLCLHSVPEAATKGILLPLVVSFLVGTTS